MENVKTSAREPLKLKALSNPCDIDFTWYNMIRDELLKKTVKQEAKVLDIGCRRGEVLLMLSNQISRGVGVDISENDIIMAEKARKKQGIKNIEFIHANALSLPFASSMFDVVLCLGDVFCYSNLAGKHDRVLAEIKRVLREDGLTIYEGMNWDWEYKVSPYWTYFKRTDDGSFYFSRTKRTPSGREISRTYEVVPETPLHYWIMRQEWHVSPQGYNTTLDVVEEEPIPKRWLKFQGVDSGQYYTHRALKRKYEQNGFRNVEVLPYGQTYDIVNQAGLLGTVGKWKAKLAKAEAEMIFKLRLGSGPWIFLVARK